MLANWLSSLLSVDKGTVIAIATLCVLGALVLRTQLEDPMIAFAFQPLLTLIGVIIYAVMQAAGVIQPIIMTDWIKGILVAAMMGNGLGIGLVLLGAALLLEKASSVETALTRKQAAGATTAMPKRVARRSPREALR